MSYFLREFISRETSVSSQSAVPQSTKVAENYGELIRRFHQLPHRSNELTIPTAKETKKHDYNPSNYPTVAKEVSGLLNVVGPPSSFAIKAIAAAVLAKYGSLMEADQLEPSTSDDTVNKEPKIEGSGKLEHLVSAGVTCVFDILRQLSRRDPELCIQALNSLLSMIQNLPADSLRHDTVSIDSMMEVLQELRLKGTPSVSHRASACLAALAVASGQAKHLMGAIESLIVKKTTRTMSTDSTDELIQVPENLHNLCLKVQQKVQSGSSSSATWSHRPLSEHRVLCSFDLPPLPFGSSTEHPDDDMRLQSAVACDGSFLYILNYIGLYKLGTGLQETLLGKLYASNYNIRSTKNCMLTFCNSSLYLRRAMSSCISVIDTDSLRDIGEVILPTSVMQCALFSDGLCFYSASMSNQAMLTLTPLNDSFMPASDTKGVRKCRLTDISFHSHGDLQQIPHQLPLGMPSGIHRQAIDLHMGADIAFVLSRSGKVYYAGNGFKYGLQDSGSAWMELMLSEPVVQLSLGSDRVLLRAGSGHVWIAGGDERRRAGKLRRLAVVNRRKVVSIYCSDATYAYVTENGKVFVGGRHGMTTQHESGHVLGLESTHIVSIALGKTHAVGISKNGYVYTWGQNHMNQCGRIENTPSAAVSPRTGRRRSSIVVCQPGEHIWVKDVASICLQCGLCSARGSVCRAGQARGSACECGAGEASCLRCGLCRSCGEQPHLTPGSGTAAPGSNPATPSRTVLTPARLPIAKGSSDVKISSVSCGNFHTVLLAADRRVFAFGSNCHGQLGTGDTRARTEPVQIQLPVEANIVQVAAGANHTVLRTADGAVFTFGANKQGQLVREGSEAQWYSVPTRVPGFGPGQPAFATWIGAVGDTTLIHSHKGLVTNDDVIEAQIVATKSDMFIFPRHIGIDYVILRRKLNTFAHHPTGPEGLYTSWCFESRYDCLWAYNAAEMRVSSTTIHSNNLEEGNSDPLDDLSFLRSPEFIIPQDSAPLVSAEQLGINLLASVYAVSTILNSTFWTDKNFSSGSPSNDAPTPEGFSMICRFQNQGGGWGYSAHSVEAVQFKCNKDIKLMGIGLYGGRGEYLAKIRISRILGGEEEDAYMEHLTESDETLFDCAANETATLLLSQPVFIKGNQWHIVSANISGPSSDCGAGGMELVEKDDIVFEFRNSAISNNGTDVNVGQIPELYYQTNSKDDDDVRNTPKREGESNDIRLFTNSSLNTVSIEVFSSLISIFDSSVTRIFHLNQDDSDEDLWQTERAAVVALLVLKLIGRYTLLVYPENNREEPSSDYAESIAQLHKTLKKLFNSAQFLVDETYCHRCILSEAVTLYIALSHCLMPSRLTVLFHLAEIMEQDLGSIQPAAVLGCLAKKTKIADMLLRERSDDTYPNLSKLILKHFSIEKEFARTLTSFTNVLRFLFEKAFAPCSTRKHDVAAIAQDIVTSISKELAVPNLHNQLGPTLHLTPTRFRRRSSMSAWDMSDSAPDAISIRVEVHGIIIHGIGVYIQPDLEEKKNWNCEIYRLCSDGLEQWDILVACQAGLLPIAGSDTGIIKLPDPLPLKPGVTYAVKIWTMEMGTRTYCGEGGVSHVRLNNGVRLNFSSCGLSENGTNLQRGQIPFFMYEIQKTKERETADDQEKTHKAYLQLLRMFSNTIGSALTESRMPTFCARSLISRISGHIMVFMERNPNKTIEIMSTLEQLIPTVSSLNGTMKTSNISESFDRDSEVCEAKSTQVVVESHHPYKSNSVQSLVVGFDASVEFMCVQFSAKCETTQADDQLWMYLGVNRESYVPIGRYYGSRHWPKSPLLLPGNSLWFVLESNAEVEGISADQMYGFHCTVTGYPASAKDHGLRLEQELAWLSANACRILVELPSDPSELFHLSVAEDDTRVLLEKHGSLLKKGLSLSHVPTLNEIIQKGLPPPVQTPDVVFLREFVAANPVTISGFLARWLPSGPVVDPTKCQLSFSGDIAIGKKVTIRVVTKDQYDRQVVCPQMSVEVIMCNGSPHTSATSFLTSQFASTLPAKSTLLQNPFQPVLLNRARYMSIGVMQAFSDFSYEEIRLAMSREQFRRDVVTLKHKKNAIFVGEWTPAQGGAYRAECKIDGFDLSHSYTIQVVERDTHEVKKVPTGVVQKNRIQIGTISQFVDFMGVRLRSSPALNSNQIGLIPRGCQVTYIDELDNDDGKWLRLTDESAAMYGVAHTEGVAWCLAFHRHLGRELVQLNGQSVEDSATRTIVKNEMEPQAAESGVQQSVVMDIKEQFVVEFGNTVPLYYRPSPDGILENEMIDGREGRVEVQTDGWIHNQYGAWVRITSTQKYILVESAGARSSLHSQSASTNGNNDDEDSPPARNQRGTQLLTSAARPSVADCCRAVFAAFLWHEHLVKDAMAAAAYLKFHQPLHTLWANGENQTVGSAPPALQPMVKLWKEISQAVNASVEQHLIMPPAVAKVTAPPMSRKEKTPSSGCELCDDVFKVPITVHMRMAHAGCGADSQGYGYNSGGKFTTGWSGDCGTGGRPGSTWYLLCTACRNQFLRKTPAGHRQERTRRWREFRLSTTAFDSRPEIIIKQNAMFLLDLNSSMDCDSKNSSTSSGWTINLFPTQTPSPMNRSGFGRNYKVDSSQLVRSSFMAQSILKGGHCSDPGPKGRRPSLMSPNTSQAPSGSLGGQALGLGGPFGGAYRLVQQNQPFPMQEQETQEVLQSPSAALRTLLSHSAPSTTTILKRPVMAFVVEHHNLKRMRDACEQSIRRALGFSHAFKVWNWLLRLVSSETSVSDIIFQYLTALSSYHRLTENIPTKDGRPNTVLPHPWRLCFLAGPIAGKMVHEFHAFLYTIAVILQSSGVDSKLRSLCFKAWTIKLTAHEQELLILTCNILATVGGVLSDGSTSENWVSESNEKSKTSLALTNVDVKEMQDVSASIRFEASSRQAMVVCLTDGSPDTFWESGEEDKSRSRNLNLRFDHEGASPALISIFLDNIRDETYRTNQVTIKATLTDGTRKDLMTANVETNFCGWMKCCIAGTSHLQIVLKGPHNACRVRQIVVLGFSTTAPVETAMRPSTSHQLFFTNTQLEAFALFQAISAQAFCGELSDDQQDALRERVVDLLCSRVQLQPLQNYVGTQVVEALEREVDLLCSAAKKNYSYACGLLDMLVRICVSRKAGELFAARNTILISISQLIIFAPQIVQCQAVHSLEKLLPIFTPDAVDVAKFLRNILVVVAKVIVLQVRDKSAHSVSTAVINESLQNGPKQWRLDRTVTPEIGKLITQLMSDICNGTFSEEWSYAIRRELANTLLNVVQLNNTVSSSASKDSLTREGCNAFVASKRFWLSVAALALIKDKSWLALTEKWTAMEAERDGIPEHLCENHDDGHTQAQVYCTICETELCRECFTVMHLHKKNRSHKVQPLNEGVQMTDIDIHQGCARMRLQNLLVLFHGESLNGLVEILADPMTTSFNLPYTSTMSLNATEHQSCRFCGNVLQSHKQRATGICDHPDCQILAPLACEKILNCGHFCGGIQGENECLQCLNCHFEGNEQDGDDVCVICFTDRLGGAPAIRLECGHLFHFHCVRTVLEKKWAGPRILFRFINCPLCNKELSHHGLSDLLEPLLSLKEDVEKKARMRLEYDGLLGCPAITDEKSEYFNRPEDYAMDRYMYVLCSQCNKAYFGGESRCQQALNTSQYNPEELICGGCSDPTGAQICARHGAEYLEYKCKFCCSIAVYFCFGTTHFCAACHDDFQRLMALPQNQLPKCPAGPRGMQLEDGPCPLRIQHAPAGQEFPMGCGICRNLQTF